MVIGPLESPLMRTVRGAVTTDLQEFNIRFVGSVADCLAMHGPTSSAGRSRERSGEFACQCAPELVIVCQLTPDEIKAADVERVLGCWPFARWIVAFSTWCQSAGRTRPIWPVSVRVPEANFRTRLVRELSVIRQESSPLPLTASSDEAVLFEAGGLEMGRRHRTDAEAGGDAVQKSISVCIHSPDSAFRRFLHQVCQEAGAESGGVFSPAIDNQKRQCDVTLIIEDVDPLTREAAARIARSRAASPEARVVALTNRSDPQAVTQLTVSGADVVFPKLGCYPLLRELLDSAAHCI